VFEFLPAGYCVPVDNLPAQDPFAKSSQPPAAKAEPVFAEPPPAELAGLDPLLDGSAAAEPQLRASDADRERVADILRDAFAEGRLDVAEHAERIEAVYAAKTFAELAPLTRDLPVHPSAAAPWDGLAPSGPQPPLPPARTESASMVAIFGASNRKGRWRVGPRIRAVAVFGGVEIDLTDAVFESPEVVIDVLAVFGGVEIKVPENVSLHGGGVGIFGGFDVRDATADDPYAPVVRVRGTAVFGGCEAKSKRGKRIKEWVRKQLDS
jgi:hypothetical protein